MKRLLILCTVLASCGYVATAQAAEIDAEVAELRQLVTELRADYDQRISLLEARLAAAERAATNAGRDAEEAISVAEQVAIDQGPSATAANTFNPSIGAVLQGSVASIDTGWSEIPGFMPAGEIGTEGSGFALGEAEINLKASIDPLYFGNLTLGVHEDDGEVELEVEEAWMQTTALPAGIVVTGGRFFSSVGYLNGFHFHADDFIDRPLPYQAMLGGRYSVDGLRASWIAPTSLFFELGAELDWGGSFPATANGDTSPGTWSAFATVGGDIGTSHSWQAGLSRTTTDAIERSGAHDHEEGDEPEEEETFDGESDLTVVDFVWKWAPDGNATSRNFKLQGEFFRRKESGFYAGLPYDGEQDGWYLQGIWQFAPRWRAGLRHDAVNADNGNTLAGTELETPGRSSRRDSVMLDWSPSEYSRWRLQYTADRVLAEQDDQWYLQYILSIGAHGAHAF